MTALWLVPLFAAIGGVAIYAFARAIYPAPIQWDAEPDSSSPEDRARRTPF